MTKIKKYVFDCNGRSAPAYTCSEPADQSGEYYKVEDIEKKLPQAQMEIPKLSKRMLAKVVKALEVAAINIPPEVIDDDKAVEIAEILIFDLIDEIKKQN